VEISFAGKLTYFFGPAERKTVSALPYYQGVCSPFIIYRYLFEKIRLLKQRF